MKGSSTVSFEANRPRVFSGQLVTIEDLVDFKSELLGDIRKIIKEISGPPQKKWLKSHEVRKLLDISPGTLQNLRLNGTLPFSRIGSVIFYDYEDIQKLITSKKQNNR